MQAIDDAPTRSANEGSWVPSSVGYNGGQQIGSSTPFSRATATWQTPGAARRELRRLRHLGAADRRPHDRALYDHDNRRHRCVPDDHLGADELYARARRA